MNLLNDWIMEKRPEELKELTELVCSSNYKERFLGEYWSLKLRAEKLVEMIKRWEEGTLTFAPVCSQDILKEQLSVMQNYLIILEKRAKIENIALTPYLRNEVIIDGKCYKFIPSPTTEFDCDNCDLDQLCSYFLGELCDLFKVRGVFKYKQDNKETH